MLGPLYKFLASCGQVSQKNTPLLSALNSMIKMKQFSIKCVNKA
jgi:hypothetical protein